MSELRDRLAEALAWMGSDAGQAVDDVVRVIEGDAE